MCSKKFTSEASFQVSPPGAYSLATLNDVEQLHIKAAKLIHKLPSETPDSHALQIVKWKPLIKLYLQAKARFYYVLGVQ